MYTLTKLRDKQGGEEKRPREEMECRQKEKKGKGEGKLSLW